MIPSTAKWTDVPVVISINLKLPAESSIANAMKTTNRINLSARNGTLLPSSTHISSSAPSSLRPNPKPNWNLSTNHPSTLPPTANPIPLSAPGNSTPSSTTGNKNIRSNKVLSASSVYRSIGMSPIGISSFVRHICRFLLCFTGEYYSLLYKRNKRALPEYPPVSFIIPSFSKFCFSMYQKCLGFRGNWYMPIHESPT